MSDPGPLEFEKDLKNIDKMKSDLHFVRHPFFTTRCCRYPSSGVFMFLLHCFIDEIQTFNSQALFRAPLSWHASAVGCACGDGGGGGVCCAVVVDEVVQEPL